MGSSAPGSLLKLRGIRVKRTVCLDRAGFELEFSALEMDDLNHLTSNASRVAFSLIGTSNFTKLGKQLL